MTQPGPGPQPVGLVRSIRAQLDDLLANIPTMAGADRICIVERMGNLILRRAVDMTPDELIRLWALFGDSGNPPISPVPSETRI